MRRAMSLGRLKKNGSSSFIDAPICQTATISAPRASCAARTDVRLTPSRFTALDHFVPQHRPDRSVEIDELRRRPKLQQVPRPREPDLSPRDDVTGWTGGE